MNERRRMTGVVTSNKMQKTVVVEISRTFRHPLYRKVVHTFHRVKAQDEIGCQMGDEVQIVESRPLSAHKRWVVEAIIKHQVEPVEAELVAAEPVEVEPDVVEPDETETGQGA
jgi:small subunit ribosomal protein S17